MPLPPRCGDCARDVASRQFSGFAGLDDEDAAEPGSASTTAAESAARQDPSTGATRRLRGRTHGAVRSGADVSRSHHPHAPCAAH